MGLAEARLKAREEQAQQDEAVVRKKLAAVEKELAALRADRNSRATALPHARPTFTAVAPRTKRRARA